MRRWEGTSWRSGSGRHSAGLTMPMSATVSFSRGPTARSAVSHDVMLLYVAITAALPANRPDTTAIVIIARWPHVSHTAFSYSAWYSKRHIIGYGRRSA